MSGVSCSSFDPFGALQCLADQSLGAVGRILTQLPKENVSEELQESEGKKTAVTVTANDRREEDKGIERSLIDHYREEIQRRAASRVNQKIGGESPFPVHFSGRSSGASLGKPTESSPEDHRSTEGSSSHYLCSEMELSGSTTHHSPSECCALDKSGMSWKSESLPPQLPWDELELLKHGFVCPHGKHFGIREILAAKAKTTESDEKVEEDEEIEAPEDGVDADAEVEVNIEAESSKSASGTEQGNDGCSEEESRKAGGGGGGSSTLTETRVATDSNRVGEEVLRSALDGRLHLEQSSYSLLLTVRPDSSDVGSSGPFKLTIEPAEVCVNERKIWP